ncbi:hypothetical protein LGI35_44915 (plasmid) [Streptomyces longhuiensis]|nr:hypothetical protein [Streptomyces longhuiensis]UDM05408.1 hypothetical protein LGI35_44915 [Streptomyces longhuiensis]
MRVPDPGSEHRHRAPHVVHRLAQPGRHLTGAGLGERRVRRFDDAGLVVLGHGSIVLRSCGSGQGVRKRTAASHAAAPGQRSRTALSAWSTRAMVAASTLPR